MFLHSNNLISQLHNLSIQFADIAFHLMLFLFNQLSIVIIVFLLYLL